MDKLRYAPIVIPTLCRNEHFMRCVESLSRCSLADQTELFIGLDYPPSDKYRPGYEAICEFIPTITGFGKVTIIKRDKNYGAVENMNDLVKNSNIILYKRRAIDNRFKHLGDNVKISKKASIMHGDMVHGVIGMKRRRKRRIVKF